MNVVLVEPEIPPNTGNISRLCAGANAALHLVRPLGFDISDRAARRAGLDYWDKVKIIVWDSLADFLAKNKDKRLFFFSTKAKKLYTEIKYQPDDYLIFGKETKGLPEDLIRQNPDRAAVIPMNLNNVRSINLSNAAAIVLYEAIRQQNFPL
ncbi:tRNA (cytidine(34)-2'-O)-methyltransferase [Candidatus Termititenax aidoneus]|uniref:Putative tRNA (cytidine(34)-2'-O)-methyltransferase n=1 Tax=Termititenax aidoneus TaxID=2218524 RepID=A0A388TCT1_TERA1|nr:tRNA (cytidine(34)-2'-O)-methyltransferase [Candidatus Termititenax aidoneus]